VEQNQSSSAASSVEPKDPGRKAPKADRLRKSLRAFVPLMRIPLLSGFGRGVWLILSVTGLITFVLGWALARTPDINEASPSRGSASWWTSPLEYNRELQLSNFDDAEIEAVAVVRKPDGQDRLFVAGRNALVAFSDDEGRTWTRAYFDPLMGGFAIPGKRSPRPDVTVPAVQTPAPVESKPAAPVPSSTPGNAYKGAAPSRTTPNPKGTPAPTTRLPTRKLNPSPVQQSNPPPKKSAAAFFSWPQLVPSVLASDKAPAPDKKPAAPSPSVSNPESTLASVDLQPQLPPRGVPAICRTDNGALVLVIGGDRAAVSRDLGETWQSTSLASLIDGSIRTLALTSFLNGSAFATGARPIRIETSATSLRGRLGDTFLGAASDATVHARSAFAAATGPAWIIAGRALNDTKSTSPNAGFVYKSDNRNNDWSLSFQTEAAALRDIAFSPNGSIGYLVGQHGSIWRTTDAGGKWLPITHGALDPKQPYGSATAGNTYWRLPPPWTYPFLLLFVGAFLVAVVISAVPGADTLEAAAEWVSKPDAIVDPAVGIAQVSVSDHPIGEEDADKLGFRPIARGVAGFLRNPKTQLPVTLAINGAWGSGKSSLMNLTSGELRRAGFRPVWFNAWHHQEDVNLLASLLQAVRCDAAPGVFSKNGAGFRLRLAWYRFARYYPRALAMVAIFLALGAAETWYDDGKHAPKLQQYAAILQDKLTAISAPPQPASKAPESKDAAPGGQKETVPPEKGLQKTPAAAAADKPAEKKTPEQPQQSLFLTIVGMLGALHSLLDALTSGSGAKPLAAIYFLLRMFPSALHRLQTFTANPAALLHSAAPGVSDKQIEAQTSFRLRFAKEFADVTRALGAKHRLVIFVDDLDRCRPSNVAEMLEAINYVTVSGDCAFVLGIETQAVRAALGLSFDAMAQEVESKRNSNGDASDKGNADQNGAAAEQRRKREEFARRYIEKLINIEMNVPEFDPQGKHALLSAEETTAPAGDPFERARKWSRAGRWLEPVALFLLVIALGWGGGRALIWLAEWRADVYFRNHPVQEQAGASSVSLAPPPVAGAPASPENPAQPQPTPQQTQSNTASDKIPANPSGEKAWPRALADEPVLWVLLTFGSVICLRLLTRVPVPPAEDSQKFKRALVAWGWIADVGIPTPRAAKRFLNRLRFLAMRQHPPRAQLSGLTKLLLTAEQQKRALQEAEGVAPVTPGSTQANGTIPDPVLVALASLEVYVKDQPLSEPAINKAMEETSQKAVEFVAKGDQRYELFLVELSFVGDVAPTQLAQNADAKAIHEYFATLQKDPLLSDNAKRWREAAAAVICANLTKYSNLQGSVEFS